jgi:hypothetical protein
MRYEQSWMYSGGAVARRTVSSRCQACAGLTSRGARAGVKDAGRASSFTGSHRFSAEAVAGEASTRPTAGEAQHVLRTAAALGAAAAPFEPSQQHVRWSRGLPWHRWKSPSSAPAAGCIPRTATSTHARSTIESTTRPAPFNRSGDVRSQDTWTPTSAHATSIASVPSRRSPAGPAGQIRGAAHPRTWCSRAHWSLTNAGASPVPGWCCRGRAYRRLLSCTEDWFH